MDRKIEPILAGMYSIVLIWIFAWCAAPAVAQGKGVRAVPEALIYTDSIDADDTGDSGATRVLIVDKSRQQINLYDFSGHWRNRVQWPCSTGKSQGSKKMEGDQKTPEGLYFVTRDVGDRYLSPVYGVRALPLDYPNWLDRRRDKGGSAIWLHGTNRPLKARDSNGCVVLENAGINQLAQYIHLQQTPVIIVDRIRLCSQKRSAAAAEVILAAMEQWHRALMYGDYFSFSHWYAEQSKPSMARWQSWCRQRRRCGSDDAYGSAMRRRTILRTDEVYVILFDHMLIQDKKQVWAGRRKLFLTRAVEGVRIIGDTYQPRNENGSDPLLLAWKRLFPRNYPSGNLASGKSGRQGS